MGPTRGRGGRIGGMSCKYPSRDINGMQQTLLQHMRWSLVNVLSTAVGPPDLATLDLDQVVAQYECTMTTTCVQGREQSCNV